MNLFVFTAGKAEARAHLATSVSHPISRELCERYLSRDLLAAVRAAGNGGVYAWGAIPGPRNVPRWEAMQPGDAILCCVNARYVYAAAIAAKTRNQPFADAVWGKADRTEVQADFSESDTWELVYFMTEPRVVDVPVAAVEDYLHKRYGGFTRLSDAHVQRIEGAFGSVDNFLSVRLGVEAEARTADNASEEIRSICWERLADGAAVPTLSRGVDNRIGAIEASSIFRRSAEATTGEGSEITRTAVAHVWRRLLAGESTRDAPVMYFTYALVAMLPGVEQRGPRDLVIADRQRLMRHFAPTDLPSFWILAANPERYDVVSDVLNSAEAWWLTGGSNLRTGDRVLICKYKGRDPDRGVVALGEVVTDPQVRAPDTAYWRDPRDELASGAPRVRVRYTVPDTLPLWERDSNPVARLAGLPQMSAP